jgi:hypothetical protein
MTTNSFRSSRDGGPTSAVPFGDVIGCKATRGREIAADVQVVA